MVSTVLDKKNKLIAGGLTACKCYGQRRRETFLAFPFWPPHYCSAPKEILNKERKERNILLLKAVLLPGEQASENHFHSAPSTTFSPLKEPSGSFPSPCREGVPCCREGDEVPFSAPSPSGCVMCPVPHLHHTAGGSRMTFQERQKRP